MMDSPLEHPESPASEGTATCFAPAGRDSPEDLRRSAALVRATPLLQATIDAVPLVVLILNVSRQVVAANRAALELLGAQEDEVLGKRPGELFDCSHCHDGPDGCGTGHHCMTCGAVAAVLHNQQTGKPVTEECRLTVNRPNKGSAMDLRVTAVAVGLENSRFTICTIEDISAPKRVAVLHRIFFHDVLNTVAGLHYTVSAAARTLDHSDAETLRLDDLVDQLTDQIKGQQDLTLAESGDLEADPEPVRTGEVLRQLHSVFAGRTVADGRTIRLRELFSGQIITDRRLLHRVLGNMLVNALEASAAGETVTVTCAKRDDRILFSVNNAAVMPPSVRLQVFQRSFSTKAEVGRGIGTHSIMLLGERYLGGKVSFTSEAPEGTTFTISLPRVPRHRSG